MNICIIAGQGNLPKILANKSKDSLVICIKGLSNLRDFQNPREEVLITQLDKIVELITKYNIKKILFTGKFFRPESLNHNFDSTAKSIFENIKNKGDNELLEVIKNFFISNGFEIIPPTYLLNDNLFNKDEIISKNYDKFKSNYLIKSSEYSLKILNDLSKFDVGQALVISGKHVIGIEGLEGTNDLIKRCGNLFNSFLSTKSSYGPVLAKFPKKNQSLDLDMPVVGVETVKLCFKHNYLGMTVSLKGTLIVDQKEIIEFCNNNEFLFHTIGD